MTFSFQIPVLVILAGVGAAACFLLALVKFTLAKRMGSLSLALDGESRLLRLVVRILKEFHFMQKT